MKIIDKTAERLVARCGSPWMGLWGLPFFAGGAWSLFKVYSKGDVSRAHMVGYVAAMLAGVVTGIMCSEHSIVTFDRAVGSLVIRHRWLPFPFRTTTHQLSRMDHSELDVQDSLCDEGYADRIVLVAQSGERIPLTQGSSGVWRSKQINKIITEYLKSEQPLSPGLQAQKSPYEEK